MMRRVTTVAFLIVGLLIAGFPVAALAAAPPAPQPPADPFDQPMQACNPCRFSPGAGQPAIDLAFVFKGTGNDRALVAFDLTPAGGKTQRIEVGSLPVDEFADGFYLDGTDLNGDGFKDLGITTETSADNASASYWLYDPKTHEFVKLQRDAANGEDCPLSILESGRELLCHLKGSAVEYIDIWYRIDGRRTVALRQEEQMVDDALLMRITTDLTVKPEKITSKNVVGFIGDSPARKEFRSKLDAASQAALAKYKAGDKAGALAVLDPLLKDKNFLGLTESVPDTSPAEQKLIGQINDYGFFLAEGGRPREAVEVLTAVVDLNPERTVAYLNLADALYAIGDKDIARSNYTQYSQRMTAANQAARIPPRVAERLK